MSGKNPSMREVLDTFDATDYARIAACPIVAAPLAATLGGSANRQPSLWMGAFLGASAGFAMSYVQRAGKWIPESKLRKKKYQTYTIYTHTHPPPHPRPL